MSDNAEEEILSGQEQPDRYAVRQVLYVTPRDGRPNIMPVQVTEEIRRTTLDGVVMTYAVRAPDNDESFMLDLLKHEVFPSADAARFELQRRASAAIDAMVEGAIATAQTHFPSVGVATTLTREPVGPAGVVAVRMPDGKVVQARVRGPSA